MPGPDDKKIKEEELVLINLYHSTVNRILR